jgi:hypothetical protein
MHPPPGAGNILHWAHGVNPVRGGCLRYPKILTVHGVKPEARGSRMHFQVELNRPAAFDFNLMAAQGFSDRILAAINALGASFNVAESLQPNCLRSSRFL